jgi:hypothetical protein
LSYFWFPKSALILIDKGLAGIEDNDVGSMITSYSLVGNGKYLKSSTRNPSLRLDSLREI